MLRFECVMGGNVADRTPVVPKTWVDTSAQLMGVPFIDMLNDPRCTMHTAVRAAMEMEFDAARLYLFPYRQIIERDGRTLQIDAKGNVVGTIDVLGGWGTHFFNSGDFDLTRDSIMSCPQMWYAEEPPVKSLDDVRRMTVPAADYYEEHYGQMLDEAAQMAQGKVSLIGDCGYGTLQFYVGMRGMVNALTDFMDDPELLTRCMEKSIDIMLERARFFVKHNIRILKYNDSTANMSVISPKMFREYILPHMTRFMKEAHALSEDVRIYCHICGNVLPIAEDLAGSGLDCIAPLDPLGGFTVGDVRKRVGDGIALMGGLDTGLLLRGTEDEVLRESSALIAENRGRYILGSGCGVARDTPGTNLRAMVKAAKDAK